MASRAGWLSDASHRIQFVYTPTHTSWLNQIELWFSENRRYIHGRKLTEARHVSYLPCAGRMGACGPTQSDWRTEMLSAAQSPCRRL